MIFSLIFVVSCSSSSKKEDALEDGTELSPEISSVSTADKKASEPMARSDREETKASKATGSSSGDSASLLEAIRANNDEAVYRISTQMLAKNPEDLRALNALGIYHYRKSHLAAAQMMFGKALKISPTSGDLHNNLGLVYLAKKELREAIREFRKAIEINPNDSIAAANVGAIYVEQKEYSKALVANEIAYRKNSKDLRVLNNYAISLVATGKSNEAKDIYKQALKINESNKDVMLNYAILLIDQMGSYQDGLDLLNKIKFLGPSAEAKNKINVLENKAKAGIK